MTTQEMNLLHPQIVDALLRLSDMNQTISRHLVRGKAAGKLEIFYGLFPPVGIHPNDVAARYTFEVEEGVHFEISVMLNHVSEGSPDHTVLGFLAHDQWAEMRKKSRGMKIDPEHCWVAVRYSPVHRRGQIFMSNELFSVVKEIRKSALETREALREEEKDRETGATADEVIKIHPIGLLGVPRQ